MVFNVKKHLNVGVGLTIRQKGRSGMSGRSSRFTPLKAGFCWGTCKRWHLSRAFETGWGPLRPKDVAWQKICLVADSVPAYTAKTTKRLLAEFRFLADWLLYSPNLNPLDFDTKRVLQAKARATPHSNLTALCQSIAAEKDRKAAVCIRKTSVFASEHVNRTFTKSFWDSMWSPGSRVM